jgi:hypothetical protein
MWNGDVDCKLHVLVYHSSKMYLINYANQLYQPNSQPNENAGNGIPQNLNNTFHGLINFSEPCVLYIGQAYRYPPNVALHLLFHQI